SLHYKDDNTNNKNFTTKTMTPTKKAHYKDYDTNNKNFTIKKDNTNNKVSLPRKQYQQQ
ncbi:14470_t:CDS:1, partial [Racocetra persica]